MLFLFRLASLALSRLSFIFLRFTGAGFIAMYATLASRDVDCCLIPESPFFLEVDVYMYFRGSGKAAEMKREAAKRTMMAALP
ncbi:ATP-dependent 6-phosphofructokinase 2-like [Camellia sinensis]|uniref:ATP-dependent 6-phosphofructokinase 2-like n=1 Tax=Camellia sinensis TaxID=4442 RepID=UPI001036C7ED|nr:ATP-dependent 6-phosphofructokinase 2-like [Camellia sinensis]